MSDIRLILVRKNYYGDETLMATIEVSLPFAPYPGLKIELKHTGNPDIDDNGGFDEEVSANVEWDCNMNAFVDRIYWQSNYEDDNEGAEQERDFLERRGWLVSVDTKRPPIDLTSAASPPQ